MKHIVLVVGSYYPNFSAVAICARNLADELKKDFRVSVVAGKTLTADVLRERYEDYDIYRVAPPIHERYLRTQEGAKQAGGIKRVYYRIAHFLIRAVKVAVSFFRRKTIRKEWVKTYFNALEALQADAPIDAVLGFCSPFESIVAAVRFKCNHQTVKVIPVLFDRFSSSTSLYRPAWRRVLQQCTNRTCETEMLAACDLVLYQKSWEHDIARIAKQATIRAMEIEHPLLRPLSETENPGYDPAVINIVYTGSLLAGFHTPDVVFRTFTAILSESNDIALHFYTRGNCNALIDEMSSRFSGKVFNHGSVATHIAHSAMLHADFLLNIPHHNIIQFPSKIFEYMSAGKPIIHFYKDEADPVREILGRYPHALLIDEHTAEEPASRRALTDFLHDNKNVRSSFEQIASVFPEALPSASAGIIKDFLYP